MIENKNFSKKSKNALFFLWTRRKQLWQSYLKEFDRQPQTLCSMSKNDEKSNFVWKKLLERFCLTRRMQIWQLAIKTKTRAERFLVTAQKSWRDTHFPESMFFFKRFSCTYQDRCQNLTTIGWSFSTQFRKKQIFQWLCYPKLYYGLAKSYFANPSENSLSKSWKKTLDVQNWQN